MRRDIRPSEGWAVVRETESAGETRGAFYLDVGGQVGEGRVETYEPARDRVPVCSTGRAVFFERDGARRVPGDPGAWFVPEAAILGELEEDN